MSIAEKLTTIAENEQKVYDAGCAAGEKSEYNRFWDLYQQNGNRKNYQGAFYGYGWSEENFKPKYDMAPTRADAMFRMFTLMPDLDLVEYLDMLGVTLDFSKSTNFNDTFAYCYFGRIGTIDTRSASNLGSVFNASRIQIIDELILKDDGSQTVSAPFANQSYLEEITIKGTIGTNGWDFHLAENLSEASGLSIINALSTTTSGLSVTLPLAWKERFIEEHGAADFEMLTILARPNWTFLWL